MTDHCFFAVRDSTTRASWVFPLRSIDKHKRKFRLDTGWRSADTMESSVPGWRFFS